MFPGFKPLIVIAALIATPALASDRHDAIDRVFERMYNFDFAGAHAMIDELQRLYPDWALPHSARAGALLFGELDRLRILQADFFLDDDSLTEKDRLKPDPATRKKLFAETAEARRLAGLRLATEPWDRDAMFAMCMATGIETDYTMLVEKRYFRSFSLSRESQMYARRLLSLDPPAYDAHLTLGATEYIVGSMNFFFRIFVRFDQIKGSKDQAIEHLTEVVEHGRYFPAFAKILLAVIHLREKRPAVALNLLTELSRDYPENQLFRREAMRVRLLMAKN